VLVLIEFVLQRDVLLPGQLSLVHLYEVQLLEVLQLLRQMSNLIYQSPNRLHHTSDSLAFTS